MPVVLIGLGVFGMAWGVASWVGWLPTIRRRGLMGGVHPDMVPMGLGLVVVGAGAYTPYRFVGLVGAGLILVGAALWARPPSWLVPAWYRRRFPPP